jgi:hypothetical protein
MATRWILALLAATLTGELSAQQPEMVLPGTNPSPEAVLFTQVELGRPTIIILVPASLQDLGTGALAVQLRAADSLIRALQSVADEWDYVFAVRAASHAAIRDKSANAHYAASQSTPGPALVIARPGSTPRLLRFWPRADQLTTELRDYVRIFRPLLPM